MSRSDFRDFASRDVVFEWDNDKRRANIAKHGIDFADAAEVFCDPKQYTLRSRIRSGETRFVSVGTAGGSLIAVVFTWRGNTVRIVSARAARRSERDQYG
ncbi:MAG TPA: BrnT family toxin [Pseudolabrys sp.]|nr:BrnT family toxin [Pseudolabrys sp.]